MSRMSSIKSIENKHVYRIVKIVSKSTKSMKYVKDKNCRKVRDHCHYRRKYRGAVHSMCNLKYSIPKKIPVVFHSGSSYDYHFIIKELAEFEKKTCLGENTKKYITFIVPREK